MVVKETETSRAPSVHGRTDSRGVDARPDDGWERRLFGGLMVLCAGFFLWFASVKILSFDELLCYFTESIPTASRLLGVQSTTPVSLDPAFYHLVGHYALGLGTNPAWSIRLFPLGGSLVMLLAVYRFTRRLAGLYAAMLSVTALILFTSFYMVEARPYGVLLGASSLALLCWSNALHRRHRGISLAGLALSLCVAMSCHYFGILVPLPILLGEAYRSWRTRSIDVGICAALFGSYLAVLGWLPFLAAAHEYKASYYTRVQWMDICRAYLPSVGASLITPRASITLTVFLLVAATLLAAAAALRKTGSNEEGFEDEWVAVTALAFLPFFGVALAYAASGAFESRYVIEFVIGIAVLTCSAVSRFLPMRALKTGLLILGFCLVGGRMVQMQHRNSKQAEDLLSSWKLVMQRKPVVITNNTEFAQFHFYHRGSESLTGTVWVADMERELAYSGTDNIDRTFLNLRRFTNMQVVSYETITLQPQPILVSRNIRADPPSWLVDHILKDQLALVPIAESGVHRIDRVNLGSR